MIALNFIYEIDELLYSINVPDRDFSNIVYDFFDFDSHSFEDLTDYLEFMEFEKYIFIPLNNSKRLNRVKNYVQSLIDLSIEVKTLEEVQILYPVLNNLNMDIKKNERYIELSNIESTNAFENGYNAFKSGIYPNTIAKGLLKHIKTDNLELFEKDNRKIYLNCAINAAIYVEYGNPEVFESPLIIKNCEEISSEEFETLELNGISQSLEVFTESGKVNIYKNIVDYGILMGLSKFNSLIFEKNNFYLDFSKTIKIGISGSNYKSLFNRATLQLSEFKNFNKHTFSAKLKEIYPYLIHINKHYDNLIFTTPYNKRKLHNIVNSSKYLNWIGFNNDNENFVMNIGTQRLFRVNSTFLDNFEFVIKNQETKHSSELQKEMEDLLNLYG